MSNSGTGTWPPLEGWVALVIGASRGIGRVITVELARQGAHVGVNYRTSEQAARAVCAEIEVFGGEALVAFLASDRASYITGQVVSIDVACCCQQLTGEG